MSESAPARRVYVAADFALAAGAGEIVARCEREPGVRVVSRWHREAAGAEVAAASSMGGPADPAVARAAALRNLEDIDACDVFVLLATGAPARGGRHFETGYAFARGKPVVVVGPREHAFHHLPGVVAVAPAGLADALRSAAP